MRIIVALIVVAIPLVLGSPFFWSLVRMAWAAEPVGYVQQDGTTQWATIGPKSFWPDWALRPENASVEVDSHFSATPTLPASGMASIAFKGEQQAVATQYEDRLRASGFEVARYAYQTWSGDIPSQPFILCMIEGVQPATPKHTLRFSFAVNSQAMPPKLYWTEGEAPPLQGMQPGACF